MGIEKVATPRKLWFLSQKNRKKILEDKGFGGAILMDLSKAFDTLNQKLVAKLHAYGFNRDLLKLINDCLSKDGKGQR